MNLWTQHRQIPSGILVLLGVIFSGCAGYYNSSTKSTSSFTPDQTRQAGSTFKLEIRALNGPDRNEDAINVIQGRAQLVRETPIQNRALLAADCGTIALVANEPKIARELLEEASTIVSSVTVDGKIENEVTATLGKESQKIFKGEPHERALIFLYKSLLCLAANDIENANAALLNASLLGSTARETRGLGDWAAVDALLQICKRSFSKEDADEFASRCVAKYSTDVANTKSLFSSTRKSVIIILGVGRGPQKKTRVNKDKSITLEYSETPSRISRVECISGEGEVPLVMTDNCYIQAATRGKRNMDTILSDKGKSKQSNEGAAQGFATTGILAGNMIPGLGLITPLIAESLIRRSQKIDSSADNRQLISAPGRLYVAFCDKSTASRGLTFRAYDMQGQLFGERVVEMPAQQENHPVVVTGLIPF